MAESFHPSVHAQRRPDHPACICGATGQALSYADLEAGSNQVAHWLRRHQIHVGDSVVVLCQNSSWYYQFVWGAHRAGVYYTPVSWHATAEEIAYIIQDSGAKAFVASSRFSKAARGALKLVSNEVLAWSAFDAVAGFERMDLACAALPSSPVRDEISGREMLYTSGTTGKPKGVKFPLPGDPIDCPQAGDMFYLQEGYGPDAVVLAPGPAYHASPLLATLAAHRFGASVLIMDKFDAEQCLSLIEQHQVTHLVCVPAHFIRLLKLPEDTRNRYDVSSVGWIVHTAAPCPVEIKRSMIDWFGPVIVEVYSGTERVGGSIIRCEDWLKHPGSIGKSPTGSAHVVDESTWSVCPAGEVGVIYFESEDHFEYHGDAEKTRQSISPQGWRTLGDIGYMDEEGYIYLTDRKSNMIITGGVNVYPQESENRMITHPDVNDVAVFGIPNDAFGEEVKAVVQLADGVAAAPEKEQELIDYCKAVLSPIKCPRSVDFMAELPREENGKLYKHKLIDRYR